MAPRLWSWARGVVADRGGEDPVPIELERREDGHGYRFRLGVRAGFGGQETARIDLLMRVNPDPHPVLKEIHYCEVAGRTLEAANVYALKAKVAALLDSVAPARALPLCFFRVPDMDYELPVYEDEGRITAPIIGGRNLRAPNLAGIRQSVCRYLVSAGYVSDVDEVEVLVLRPRDLRRVPPAAVFRSHADPDFWLPSVDGVSPEGPVIGALDHAARLRSRERRRAVAGPVPRETGPAAPDVLSLLRFLRSELARSRRRVDPESLYAAEVRPDVWRAAEARMDPPHANLVAYLADDDGSHLELPVRHTGAGDVAVALEERGITAFVAASEEELASTLGRHLAAAGFLRFAEEVEVAPLDAPRAERLEADTIWTFGDRPSVAEPTTEEAHA